MRLTKANIERARQVVKQHGEAYCEETGVGPCGGLAVLMARAGWGTLAMCETRDAASTDEYAWYPHYVVIRNGKVVDISGEYLAGKGTPVYRELEAVTEADILACGPGTIYGESDVNFWRTRLEGVVNA